MRPVSQCLAKINVTIKKDAPRDAVKHQNHDVQAVGLELLRYMHDNVFFSLSFSGRLSHFQVW